MMVASKNMIAGNGSIAAGFVRALVALAVDKGARRATLLEAAGLAEAMLDDQDSRIPMTAYMALMRAGKQMTGDAALALHFGEAFDIGELSIVGLIGSACATVGEAMAAMSRYERLIADVGDNQPRLALSREDDEVWLIDRRENPNAFPELTESSFARIASTSRRMPGVAPLLRAVHVTHPAPDYRSEYDRIFQVPVHFEAARNALLVEGGDWLSAKPPLPSRYLFGVLSTRAEALLKDLEAAKTTRGRVECLLMPLLHTGEASVALAAARLGVSRQTLFRRLKSEGVTFQQVLDGLRQRLAQAYLAEKKVSVNEMAYLLGFSDPAAFSRAFKRWTGASPRQAR